MTTLHGGIDIGSESHHIIIMDDTGKVLCDRKVAHYEKKRAEGKDHNHALRCLARQLIKVIFKMLTENREYIYKEELKKAA